MSEVRVAVVSDIHASHSDLNTHVTAVSGPRPKHHPLNDLIEFAEEEKIRADFLLVPGDIADQASAIGLPYAWRRLHELAEVLSAELVAAPGNHDVVTHEEVDDPKAMLKSLVPSFPTGIGSLDRTFWEKGWVVHEVNDDVRILVLDSTFGFPTYPVGVSHNTRAWKEYLSEIDRGTFPESVEDELRVYLDNAGLKINLAIVHHHPQEHQLRVHMQDQYGPMKRGGELTRLLSEFPRAGRWVIIHGHKHIPQLAQGTAVSSNGPLLLCSASLGGKLWSPITTVTRNQFHVVTASNEAVRGTGSIRGSVESFMWIYADGWMVSERKGSGLPFASGFGNTRDTLSISNEILTMMKDQELPFIRYGDLTKISPELLHLLPEDFSALEDELRLGGYSFLHDNLNKIVQLTEG